MSEPGAIRRMPRPGTIVPFGGDTVPDGWLLCNGAAVSRTDYARLYSAIGTAWGSGDGSTTFNLPDGRGKVLQGADSTNSLGDSVSAGLPDVYGSSGTNMAAYSFGNESLSRGAFTWSVENAFPIGDMEGDTKFWSFTFYNSDSNSLYGNANTVQPPAIATQYVIRC